MKITLLKRDFRTNMKSLYATKFLFSKLGYTVYNPRVFIRSFSANIPLCGVDRASEFYTEAAKLADNPTADSIQAAKELADHFSQKAIQDHKKFEVEMKEDRKEIVSELPETTSTESEAFKEAAYAAEFEAKEVHTSSKYLTEQLEYIENYLPDIIDMIEKAMIN
jgi:hypothetical protein